MTAADFFHLLCLFLPSQLSLRPLRIWWMQWTLTKKQKHSSITLLYTNFHTKISLIIWQGNKINEELPRSSVVKNQPTQWREIQEMRFSLGWKIPGGEMATSPQCSCLKNPQTERAWQATQSMGLPKSQTQLNNWGWQDQNFFF